MHRLLVAAAAILLALALSGGAAAWSWPADGAVLRPFSFGSDAYAAGQHRGIDVAGQDGSAVRAPAAGVVSFAGSLPTYGRGVTITTQDGYAVTLVHLGSVAVSKGDSVAEGATIGTMGTSGTPEQSVPSVHLGVRRADDDQGYVDPLGLLPSRPAPSAPGPAAPPEPAPMPTPVATHPLPPQVTPPAASPVAPPAAPVVAAPSAAPPPAAVAPAPEATTTVSASAHGTGTAPVVPAGPVETAPAGGSVGDLPATEPGGEASPGTPAARALVVVRSVPARSVPSRPPSSADDQAPALRTTPALPRGAPTQAVSPARAAQPASAARAQTVVSQVRPSIDASDVTRPSPVARPGHGPAQPKVPSVEPAASSGAKPLPGPRPAHAAVPASRAPALVAQTSSTGLPRPASPDPIGLPEMIAAIALAALVVAAGARRLARRIGCDGAVLRHHADLLRQLDAAHRPRLHDRRGRRLRTPSTAARS